MGHEYVHVPAAPSKVAPLGQDVQSMAVSATHSPHESSQAWQTRSASAYLPGGHVDMQVPSSKYLSLAQL